MSSFVYGFGPFELDARTRRVTRSGAVVPLGDRHVGVLLHLVSNAGATLSKDALISEAWGDVAVTDNSLEQIISSLRKILREGAGMGAALETVPRRGYRFMADVRRTAGRESDEALDALLAPHRAWMEGRAALETLERDHIGRARAVFERAMVTAADQASPHIGLANACVMQYEMTRAEREPDTAALAVALEHAREACRLDPASGEAWATLGFVLDRVGQRTDALAAARRSVMLEPDNWRHYFRLSLTAWGEERLRAARRVLSLLPGFPLAHFVAATVYVARQAFDEAERELTAGVGAGDERSPAGQQRFSSVALHWLLGLVHLARDDRARALEEFGRELAREGSGHLYARECAANAWYAIGVMRRQDGDSAGAAAAFAEAAARSPRHPFVQLVQGASAGPVLVRMADEASARSGRADGFMASAAARLLTGDAAGAAAAVEQGLGQAAPGDAGWLLPVEPLFAIRPDDPAWAGVLARLRSRAA